MKIALVLHKYGVALDDPCCYPLGFMYISAVLKQLGHDVKVLNYNLWDYDLEAEVKYCDVVCFTGFEEFKARIITDAATCKSLGIKTVLGGALATFSPEEMLQHVDTVVVGEGEDVISLALQTAGVVHGSKPDLSLLPYPDYEGFGITEYHRRNSIKHVGVLTARGCPHKCRFCAQTCFVQLRNLDHVFLEIEAYRSNLKAELVVFNDNTLNLNKKRFLEICRRMTLPWTAAIRVDNFDEEMAIAAKQSGCQYFVVGVESVSQPKLDAMHKGIKVHQIFGALDLLHKYGIGYHGNLILGIEGDTLETINEELFNTSWHGYNIMPVVHREFVGTQAKNAANIDLSSLTAMCKKFVQERGYTYWN